MHFRHLVSLAGLALLAGCEAERETEPVTADPQIEPATEQVATTPEPGTQPVAGQPVAFTQVDADSDKQLTRDEFREGLRTRWASVDADSSGWADPNEFNTAFPDLNANYGTWDADTNQQLTYEEFEAGLWDQWNKNDNEMLEQNEWGWSS